jgi:general stress protein 26
MSKRKLIEMTADEIAAYLSENEIAQLAGIGPAGYPHVSPMIYGFFEDGALGFWTFAKSQKVKNFERNPKASCLIESGRIYAELKGVEFLGEVSILPEEQAVLEIGNSIYSRYKHWFDFLGPDGVKMLANKRVALKMNVKKTMSWDHSKLNGSY